MKTSILAFIITTAFSVSSVNAAATSYDQQQDAAIDSLVINSNGAFKQIQDNKTAQDAYNTQTATSLYHVEGEAQHAQDTADKAYKQANSNYSAISDEISMRQRQGYDLQNQIQDVSDEQRKNDAAQTSALHQHESRLDAHDTAFTNHETRISQLENQPKPRNGVDGIDGKNGATGAAGKNGVNGKDGKAGKDGVNGSNGKNGLDGRNGVTTTVTKIQEDKATQRIVKRNSTSTANNAADLKAVHQALNKLNATNNKYSSLKDEVDNNKKQANAGISGAMAMAGLPQVQANQQFMFSAGAATYESESALAVGGSVNFNDHVVGKVSFSADTASNMGASVGVGVGF
ncbi:YadA C-terminal domain-containing protein [Pseudocitrobacter vendiensis]|uniref:Collagen triple helix repeat protein n=1 Tax=Pseudocitrobacter vendiensis TaxID=2488306 RepID=A0ABM9F7L9_9ENTR|nr:YadA-like family protein [Pseudocitrobacter vendiensis]CAH6636802.1 Collagen triple helix repeat protein [Pseudocitrobacter vendiensis]